MKGAIKTVGQKLLKVAAFAVMAVMVFVGGFTTSELLRKEEQQSVIKGTGNSLQAQQTINNGISLMAADGTDYVEDTLGDQAPYGALKVTATVTPATAKNQKLSWSCTWKGGGNEWSATAGSVDQYLRIQSVGTNAQELYVWSLQAFGCAVDVTATSTDGTNKTATMTVDFAKRMNGITDAGYCDQSGSVIYSDIVHGSYELIDPDEFKFNATYSVGTKDLTWTCVGYSILFSQGFDYEVYNAFSVSSGDWTWTDGKMGFADMAYNIFSYEKAVDLFFDGGADNAANYNKLLNCIAACDNYCIGDITFCYESAEVDSFGNKYRYDATFELRYLEEYLGLVVENVNLSDSTLTF